jgi:hypothetical protein
LIQVVLIFCGVLGILGLLAQAVPVEAVAPKRAPLPTQDDLEAEPSAKGQEIRV